MNFQGSDAILSSATAFSSPMRMISVLCGILLLMLFSGSLFSQGTVYLVIGSDTAIWESMDVEAYNCTYLLTLYTDPSRNAARVMDPAFRLLLRDYYGTPVKLTWWMMGGNIFRHATNTNVPNPNIMTLYLMKKYHGNEITRWGDELTLHYHTFVWTDYNGDGKYYWNQARSFAESSDDFDVTLAEMLLEEETFPVSFRSGWETMDNVWQQRLDMLLPYSLHNSWPSKANDSVEPISGVYDWSRAPSTFVPYHPSPTDYQVPGSGRGWNVRSTYMASADSAFMAKIFKAAAAGTDQVACLWAHLPETDFLDNIRKVDASTHKAATRFPNVPYRYCTAREAMRLWRRTSDTTRAAVTLEEIPEGSMLRWAVRSNEPLFQPEPFIAVKDKYGEYQVLPSHKTGRLSWETSSGFPRADLAKAGVAVTDTAGNLTTIILRYLSDDIFIDDTDAGYAELSGSWVTASTNTWGTTSRVATLGKGDSVKARWTVPVAVAGLHSFFVQLPAVTNPAQQLEYRILEDGRTVSKLAFSTGVPANRWVYIGTQFLSPASRYSVEVVAWGSLETGMHVAADVVKCSALVRDRWLVLPESFDVGEVIVQEKTTRWLTVRNEGVQPVSLVALRSLNGMLSLKTPLPVSVPAMGEIPLEFTVEGSVPGSLTDTLEVGSDDPRHLTVKCPVRGNILQYFVLVDDRDSLAYTEHGQWYFSTGHAYGTTSRYAFPGSGASAVFTARLSKGGSYQVREIVPSTANASARARYVLRVNGQAADSAFLDQNAGSGTWITLFERTIATGSEVRVEISDAMSPVLASRVLRADAVRFQLMGDGATGISGEPGGLPASFSLEQNFPNPFNPATTIRYAVPAGTQGQISVRVFDIVGREVVVLVNEKKTPGRYEVQFDASRLPSGVYLCRLTAGGFAQTRKMIVLR